MTGYSAVQTDVGIPQAGTPGEVQPLFRMAVLKGATCSVLLHLRRGAPINGRDSRGLTPLMLAAAAGREDICALLVAEGADKSTTAPDKRTASDFASAAGFSRLAMLLAPTTVTTARETPFGLVDPTGTLSTGREITDWSEDSWKVEEVFQAALPDLAVLPAVRDMQAALTTTKVINSDPDWRDVRVDLPIMRQVGKTPDLDLVQAITNAVAYERIPAGRFHRLTHANCGITQLLEDLGIDVDATAFEADVTARIGGRLLAPADRELLADAEEALGALQVSASSEELFAAEVGRIPYVDRGAEQSMFRAFDTSRRGLFRHISQSVVLVPGFLVERANSGGPMENGALVQATTVPASEDDSEAHSGASVEIGAQGSVRTLVQILLAIHESALPIGDEIFVGIDVDLDLADRLKEALHRDGHADDSKRLAAATRRYLRDRNRIAEANLALALKIAPRYARGNVTVGDLVQEASIGLLRAIDRFDASRGNRFSAYAVWWIRQSCSRVVDDLDRTIRLPVYFVDNLKRVETLRLRMSHQLGRPPHTTEIAKASGLRLDLLRRLEELTEPVVQLENPEVCAAVGLVVDEADSAFDQVLAEQRKIVIAEAVSGLEARDAEVVRRRFGLDFGDDETLEEIGRDMGVTRERIRQLETRAFKQLARPGSLYGRRLRSLL